jgi:superfamily II DNA helicase RecQ
MDLSHDSDALSTTSNDTTPPPPPTPPLDGRSLMFNHCSEQVWDEPVLRPSQLKILHLLFDPHAPNAVLAVYRTGEGKSHMIRMVGVVERSIALIFIPILKLSADVFTKFQSACHVFGSVNAYHLDELYDSSVQRYNKVLDHCQNMQCDTWTTTFVFLSPQDLCYSPRALDVFISCGSNGTLRTIVLDEVHLHVAHGLSFRDSSNLALDEVYFQWTMIARSTCPVFCLQEPTGLNGFLIVLLVAFKFGC